MKQLKRKRGRPKKAPQSPAQLKEEARERIRQSAVRRAAEEAYELPLPPQPEEVIEEASAVTRKHRYTKEEMTELKQKLDFICKRYIEEQQAEEAETNRELNGKLREIALSSPKSKSDTKLMTESEWHLAHGLREDGTKRRGPKQKTKKTVWDLSPGEGGTADSPSEPVDLDAMETEFERQMFERHIEKQRNQPQMVKGMRFRRPEMNVSRPQPPKNFWY